jgi:glycosyltransferase involved in cell wall biosynthesis
MPKAAVLFIVSISMACDRSFRIGYWLSYASLEHGGIGPYALRTISALLTAGNSGVTFALLCHEADQALVNKIVADAHQNAEIHLIPPAPVNLGSEQQIVGATTTRVESASKAEYLSQAHLLPWLDGLQLDLMHLPMSTPPHSQEHVPYVVPPLLELRTPYIATIHDVQELLFPEYFSPAQRAIRAMHRWEVMDHASKIIVSYDHVKEDLIRYFPLVAEKVHVCPIAYQSISFQEPSSAAARIYEEKYRSWKTFLLYPAQTWPHKNHNLLLQALQRIRRRWGMDLRLICTGHPNDYQQVIIARAEELGVSDAVFFSGIVPEDELAWLYRHSALVTIPTEYEAGSFPLIEAVLLGVPVICSDVTSLPETIGDRRFTFSPDDVDALSDLIFLMLTDAVFRQENVTASARRAEHLRSIDSAAYIYATYQTILAEIRG